MIHKMFLLILLLLSGCNHSIPSKIIVPKPPINDIVLNFKPIKHIEVINGKVCFLKEDAENLQYNIAMSRIYFIQSQMNLKLVQEHYSKVMAGLGVVEQ